MRVTLLKLLVSFFCYAFFLCLFLSGELPAQKFNSGKIEIGLSSSGAVRISAPKSICKKQVYRLSLLAGIDKSHAFTYIEDQDSVTSSSNILHPKESDFEISGTINNSFSKQPPDLIAEFNILGWTDAPYAVIKITLTNHDIMMKDINPYIGFEFLPQTDSSFSFVTIKFNNRENVITSFRSPSSTYTALKMYPNDIVSLRTVDWPDYYEKGSGSDSVVYSLMTSKKIDTLFTGGALGTACLFSQNYTPLKLNSSTTVFLITAVGSSETEVLENIRSAESRYFMPTSLKHDKTRAAGFVLNQNYPNPFNPSTNISFSLPEKDFIRLKVYDVLGREIQTLINSEVDRGLHKVMFENRSLPGGIYFYSLENSTHSEIRKMIIAK